MLSTVWQIYDQNDNVLEEITTETETISEAVQEISRYCELLAVNTSCEQVFNARRKNTFDTVTKEIEHVRNGYAAEKSGSIAGTVQRNSNRPIPIRRAIENATRSDRKKSDANGGASEY